MKKREPPPPEKKVYDRERAQRFRDSAALVAEAQSQLHKALDQFARLRVRK